MKTYLIKLVVVNVCNAKEFFTKGSAHFFKEIENKIKNEIELYLN